MATSGVTFHYSAVLGQSPAVRAQLAQLFEDFGQAGIRTAVFSTHRKNLDQGMMEREGFPRADVLLYRAEDMGNPAPDEVAANKGSPLWSLRAAEELGCQPHQLVSVGVNRYDWTGAIGAAVLPVHAGWVCPKPDDVKAFKSVSPKALWTFLTHFTLAESRFKFILDLPGQSAHFRSLFTANSTSSLAGSDPASFNLVQVFAEDRKIDVRVGPTTAADLLMVHTLTSLYEEGLIDRYSRFTVYPGHAPGTYNETLAGFINFLAKHVQAYDRDLLVRAVEAPDTSKYRQSHGGVVPYSFQSNTVHLNPSQVRNIKGKSVVVFDDFTTDGNGLDWARNLLVAAGARRVLLVTIGKFVRGGNPCQLLMTPRRVGRVKPYELVDYEDDDFERMYAPFVESENRATILRKSFLAMKDSAPLEI